MMRRQPPSHLRPVPRPIQPHENWHRPVQHHVQTRGRHLTPTVGAV